MRLTGTKRAVCLLLVCLMLPTFGLAEGFNAEGYPIMDEEITVTCLFPRSATQPNDFSDMYLVKQFRENGYVEMEEDGFLTLTPMGLEIAERVYERHVLLEELLCAIGVDAETAKEDACRIEHDLSDVTFRKIKEYMQKIKEGK